MTVVTSTAINAIVDGLITLITNNGTTLGLGSSGTKVYEWDEHPMIPAERGDLPVCYVIPVVEGGDNINMAMGSADGIHNFNITVAAYYWDDQTLPSQIRSDLRTYRNYAYAFRDLFRTSGDYFGDSTNKAHVWALKLEPGYFLAAGGMIHFWIATLKCKTII